MMSQTKIGQQQHSNGPIGSYPRHLRLAIVQGAAACKQAHRSSVQAFFPLRFLLHRGMPIIARHLVQASFSDAIDLTLAWAEEWPVMSAHQRAAQVKALTPIAADLLQRIGKRLMLPLPVAIQPHNGSWSEAMPPLVKAVLPNESASTMAQEIRKQFKQRMGDKQ